MVSAILGHCTNHFLNMCCSIRAKLFTETKDLKKKPTKNSYFNNIFSTLFLLKDCSLLKLNVFMNTVWLINQITQLTSTVRKDSY